MRRISDRKESNMRPKPDSQKFTAKLAIPVTASVAEAIDRAAAPKMQGRAAYVREAILFHLQRDGAKGTIEQPVAA
jgi:hypothetical protein